MNGMLLREYFVICPLFVILTGITINIVAGCIRTPANAKLSYLNIKMQNSEVFYVFLRVPQPQNRFWH